VNPELAPELAEEIINHLVCVDKILGSYLLSETNQGLLTEIIRLRAKGFELIDKIKEGD
jgi:hypothetical protein